MRARKGRRARKSSRFFAEEPRIQPKIYTEAKQSQDQAVRTQEIVLRNPETLRNGQVPQIEKARGRRVDLDFSDGERV